ncbi:NGG1p interacting factor NIF3 [Methylomonas sp. LL1]|uniref:NGG1p interacting factor NIF3 n=1 Tax=Methylomonas sp. LL1 TaxID=2785785 RepID=UPI0018C3A459|nr:NGG1p interacting factor NIF3 [Methylomonas sp. LL1]QPK62975.1 NGG1p interacting factor NIF3 [Methylomonas sp. LL1]
MYQLIFYVPASHLDSVKNAVFTAGAGQYHGYDQCAWQTLGQGQFKPLAGSRPYSGDIGQLKTVPEYKVEMICTDSKIKAAIEALLAAHPYEQPAYSVYRILGADDLP